MKIHHLFLGWYWGEDVQHHPTRMSKSRSGMRITPDTGKITACITLRDPALIQWEILTPHHHNHRIAIVLQFSSYKSFYCHKYVMSQPSITPTRFTVSKDLQIEKFVKFVSASECDSFRYKLLSNVPYSDSDKLPIGILQSQPTDGHKESDKNHKVTCFSIC